MENLTEGGAVAKGSDSPRETQGFAAKITPDEPVVAGSRGTWTVEVTVGKLGLAIGGGIRITPPTSERQVWDVGHVTAATSRSDTGLRIETENTHPLSLHHSQYPVIRVVVERMPLVEGDAIQVTLGDVGGYVTGFLRQAQAPDIVPLAARFEVAVDIEGNTKYSNPNYPMKGGTSYLVLEDSPELKIIPGEPAKLVVTARSTPPVGDDFPVALRAVDSLDNPCDHYHGTVELKPQGMSVEGPESAELEYCGRIEGLHAQTEGRAVAKGSGSRRETPGIGYLGACDWSQGIAGRSNPICPGFFGDELQAFFGEIHCHTEQSDGHRTHDEAYEFARDAMGLDFSAVSDHEGGRDWSVAVEAAKKYNDPGRFVTFLGFEHSSSGHHGHRNVYYLHDDEPCFRPDHPDELFEELEGREAIVIPHHPNTHSEGGTLIGKRWRWYDLDTHNPRFERLVEICQLRGSMEAPPPEPGVILPDCGSSVRAMLARGFRLGFIGGTDNHRGQPASYLDSMGGIDYRSNVVGGLAAVIAPELTRESLFQAMYDRRTFATSGERMLIDMRVGGAVAAGSDRSRAQGGAVATGSARSRAQGGAWMGEELRAEGEVTISLRAVGTRPLKQVDLIKSGSVLRTWVCEGIYHQAELTDPAGKPGSTDYYYARAIQEDGHLAWASPCWVTWG